ncbi:MAG: hypothetical protein GXN93_03735 [Candidatus Diapherotrites archaeon]|nr:hypothetical protein [Candidatus Diapherotrites archaeon]
MDALSGSALIFSVLVGAMMVGGLIQYLGILPQIGYILAGHFIMPALPQSIQSFLFASGIATLMFYLGYVASSRRIFNAPLQTTFIQPVRVAIGFAMFFILFYVSGVGISHAITLAILFSTSSALILRWGKRFAHRGVEEAMVALDAAVTAIVLMYALGVSGWGILLTAAIYAAYFFSKSRAGDVVVAAAAVILWYFGILHSLSVIFILGAFTHHRIHGAGEHWIDPIIHDAIPLYFLFALAGAMQYPITVSTALIFVAILAISYIQNFISFVILGPLFGIPPKTGAYMAARSLGPSEAALAAAILSGSQAIATGAIAFYTLSLFIYSFVKTDADAERFVSATLPKRLYALLEKLEGGYAPVYVKMRALISGAFSKKAYYDARQITTALILIVAATITMLSAVTQTASHSVAHILISVVVIMGAVWIAVPAYMRMYCNAVEFLSKYVYERPLRPGHAPRYFVGGYLSVIAGFILLPLTIASANIVIIFFALLFLNLGLYVLLNSYYQIVQEMIPKARA